MDMWERIRNAVRKNNTTQAWIAEKAGVPFGTFQRWLSHKTMPNADQAVRIAQALGTTVEELVTGEDLSLPPQQLRELYRNIAALPDDDIAEIEAIVLLKLNRYQENTKHA